MRLSMATKSLSASGHVWRHFSLRSGSGNGLGSRFDPFEQFYLPVSSLQQATEPEADYSHAYHDRRQNFMNRRVRYEIDDYPAKYLRDAEQADKYSHDLSPKPSHLRADGTMRQSSISFGCLV